MLSLHCWICCTALSLPLIIHVRLLHCILPSDTHGAGHCIEFHPNEHSPPEPQSPIWAGHRIPGPSSLLLPPIFCSPSTPKLPLLYLSTGCQRVLRVQCLAGPGAFLADGFALPFVSAADARPALLNYKQCRMSHHLTLSRTEFKFQTDKKLSTESNQIG